MTDHTVPPATEPCSAGAFSISLTVADLSASIEFYGLLGFSVSGGDDKTWSILINGDAVIGLFHGMFDKNILTFNPGWAGPGRDAENFEDVRVLRQRLADAGLAIDADTTSESESGPASFVIVDPDGNPVMIDQHV